MDFERKTLNLSDDEKVFVRIETGEYSSHDIERYQYDNHLGSACLELDRNGMIISYEEYHPFGTTSYRSGRSEIEVSLKRYKYCGKEKDEETGLYYYGARYYAAWLCRFVSVDPLADKYPNISSYFYCENNPTTLIDPNGKRAVRPVRLVRNTRNVNRYALYPNGIAPNSNKKSTSYLLKSNGILRIQLINVNPKTNINPEYIRTVNTAGGNKVQMTPNNLLAIRLTSPVELVYNYKENP